jgi:hypothetical protein
MPSTANDDVNGVSHGALGEDQHAIVRLDRPAVRL